MTIARIESGGLSPTVAMLDKLATALDIDVRDFFASSRRTQKRGKHETGAVRHARGLLAPLAHRDSGAPSDPRKAAWRLVDSLEV